MVVQQKWVWPQCHPPFQILDQPLSLYSQQFLKVLHTIVTFVINDNT